MQRDTYYGHERCKHYTFKQKQKFKSKTGVQCEISHFPNCCSNIGSALRQSPSKVNFNCFLCSLDARTGDDILIHSTTFKGQ